MKKALISIALLIFLFPNNKAFAQNAQNQNTNQSIKNIFSISPIIIDTKIAPGVKQTIPVNIKNQLGEPLGINVTVENFYPSDGQTIIKDLKNSPLVEWITPSKTSFILSAKESQNINLSINPPQNLKKSGYYAVVFFTPIYSKSIDNSSPSVISKVGTLIFATYGNVDYQNLKEKVSVDNLTLGGINERSPINYSFAVSNSYFTHFSGKPFLYINPLFGKPLKIIYQDKRILPGTSRLWDQSLDTTGLSFFNTFKLKVSVGEGNYVEKDGFFFILPIKEILIAILLILIGLIIKFRGKQIKKAAKILFKG